MIILGIIREQGKLTEAFTAYNCSKWSNIVESDSLLEPEACGGKWYCSYPELRECHDPAMLPVYGVRIEGVKMNDIRLSKNIYTRKHWTS